MGSVAGNSRVDIIDRRSGTERNASAFSPCTSIELYNHRIDMDFAYIFFLNISHGPWDYLPDFFFSVLQSPRFSKVDVTDGEETRRV